LTKIKKKKQRNGSSFDNTLVNNRNTSIFLNRKGIPREQSGSFLVVLEEREEK